MKTFKGQKAKINLKVFEKIHFYSDKLCESGLCSCERQFTISIKISKHISMETLFHKLKSYT